MRRTQTKLICGPDQRIHQRRGYVLVFFAMLSFGLMGLAALVIDIGFVRLTQRQMQTAADAAALEGMRFRDDPSVVENARDAARRQRASDVVAWTFDDDLNPDNGDDGAFYDSAYPNPHAGDPYDVAGRFGAGPVLKFTDGAGPAELAARQFINSPENQNSNSNIGSYPAVPFYKPRLSLNLANALNGDMVAGEFLHSDEKSQEFNDYQRNDFETTGDTAGDSAFLVRLRRTNDFQGLDNQEDVSSSGPPIPLLFGRGSLVSFLDPAEGYSPRHHGMTARATSIAAVRIMDTTQEPPVELRVGNVTLAGPAFPVAMFPDFLGLEGVTPFCVEIGIASGIQNRTLELDGASADGAIRLYRVTELVDNISLSAESLVVQSSAGFPTEVPFTIRVDNELMSVTNITSGQNWTVVRGVGGTAAAEHRATQPVLHHASLRIGVALAGITSDQLISDLGSVDSTTHRFVPVFSMSTQRIVGFVYADSWSWIGAESQLSITFAGQYVVCGNASSGISHAHDALDLIPTNRCIPNSVQAPVLVR